MYKIIPAYGRYANSTYESVVKDWNEGKDFKFMHGPYLSIRDFESIKEENYHQRIDDILFGSKEDAPVLIIFFKEAGSDYVRQVRIFEDGSKEFC